MVQEEGSRSLRCGLIADPLGARVAATLDAKLLENRRRLFVGRAAEFEAFERLIATGDSSGATGSYSFNRAYLVKQIV